MKFSSSSSNKSRRKSQIDRRYKGITAEIILKLVLSWIVTIAALASAIKLLPYQFSGQAKLKEVSTQVAETEARVVQLREQLNRNFDPEQNTKLTEQYSSSLAPNRSRLFLLPESSEKTKK
jgi:outer membrane murein-binding lipoprotein Lpp